IRAFPRKSEGLRAENRVVAHDQPPLQDRAPPPASILDAAVGTRAVSYRAGLRRGTRLRVPCGDARRYSTARTRLTPNRDAEMPARASLPESLGPFSAASRGFSRALMPAPRWCAPTSEASCAR